MLRSGCACHVAAGQWVVPSNRMGARFHYLGGHAVVSKWEAEGELSDKLSAMSKAYGAMPCGCCVYACSSQNAKLSCGRCECMAVSLRVKNNTSFRASIHHLAISWRDAQKRRRRDDFRDLAIRMKARLGRSGVAATGPWMNRAWAKLKSRGTEKGEWDADAKA